MAQMLDTDELLKLVPNSELESFAELLGCNLTTSNLREEMAVKLQNCSRTKVLSALIALNGIWLAMMRDVVQFLEKCQVSMRTTGCILALPLNGQEAKLYLSSQIADLVARFDESTIKPKKLAGWDEALADWRELESWFRRTVQHGTPYRRKKLNVNGMIKAAARSYRPPTQLYEERIVVDRKAAKRMFCLWRTLDYLDNKLKAGDDLSHLPQAATQLRGKLARQALYLGQEINRLHRDRDLWRELKREIKQTDAWSDSWPAEELFQDECWQHNKSWDEWVRFIEDVLSLANLETSPEIADLLRLDLLKDRPRLFEVWCMSQILLWYRSWGCIVELESVKTGTPPTWNLNFSRAAEPVARIERGGAQWWFFYQLFRIGTERANMPDLALLDGRSPASDVIWIADPKYSEAGGYSRKDYVEVAERYRDAFQPQHTWICEFFDRREWFDGNCYESGNRISILSEVQPKGEGLRILKRDLSRIHGFPLHEIVLAVDCSGSFIDKLPQLEAVLQKLVAHAAAIICFAGEAKELNGTPSVNFATVQIEGGTCLRPLVLTLETLSVRDSAHTTLVLVTDGDFSDATVELRASLEKMFVRIEQVEDENSLARIITEYCAGS